MENALVRVIHSSRLSVIVRIVICNEKCMQSQVVDRAAILAIACFTGVVLSRNNKLLESLSFIFVNRSAGIVQYTFETCFLLCLNEYPCFVGWES